MNWKKLLTNPFKKKKEKVKFEAPKGVRPPDENLSFPEHMMNPEDAVKALPQDVLDKVKNYKSIMGIAHKMTEDQQLELMELIARYSTPDEINQYFVSKYRMSISWQLINQYKKTPKWKPVIKKLREKYLIDTDDVAISHKRVRLDRAEKASQIALKDGNINGIINANADAREEVVGKQNQGAVNMTLNQFNGMTFEEIQEQKKILLARLQPKIVELKKES